VPPAPDAPGPEIPPQKLVTPAPLTLTIGVAMTFAELSPTTPVKVVSVVHEVPVLVEYIKLKLVGPVPDARPMIPLSVILVKPTVDVQNLRPAAGNATSHPFVDAAVLPVL
jgi:hypothetical protein